MVVRFWGVRGSIPCADSKYMRYGGDTSCVSVEAKGQLIIFDAGSGIRKAGLHALATGYQESHLFLSHVHIDHILGYPFYGPIWKKGHKLSVYADHLKPYGGLQRTIFKAFEEPIFPVPMSKLSATVAYHDIESGQTISFDETLMVKSAPLNHPNGATGYRVQYGKSSVCYITDTEHLSDGVDPNIVNLIRGTDLLIYDSSYTDDEYVAKVSWGHSTWQEGVKLCKAADVKQLCIFHHDPDHKDDVMDSIAREAKESWPNTIVAKQDLAVTFTK
ncbi:MAG: MBL fold metallo-hydrolase [Alphaproteobacteria bacterium]|nr:MBL fold metallo-hydrolase [Alphaproteobacteria bacterium]OJV46488.1 MAG: MBL fold metallo-hydrolase [Alphaproteobacteria bacterium 43-37]